jgi:hypothetical protein
LRPGGVRFAVNAAVARLAFVLLSLVCGISLTAETRSRVEAAPDIQPTLERFLNRPDEPVRQYRARRVLEGENERFNMRATLEAVTVLAPGGHFTYTIVNETGSDYIRRKVLRPLLETEAEVFASGDPSRSALTEENYVIGGGELAEPGLVKLFAKPKRKDVALIDGAVFVTSDDADLVRIEGRMAKSPSFWASRVHIVRYYDRIGGARVPVRLDSTASIKLAGTSTLSMTYTYEMVNGVTVTE